MPIENKGRLFFWNFLFLDESWCSILQSREKIVIMMACIRKPPLSTHYPYTLSQNKERLSSSKVRPLLPSKEEDVGKMAIQMPAFVIVYNSGCSSLRAVVVARPVVQHHGGSSVQVVELPTKRANVWEEALCVAQGHGIA
jgi:hypothetical protein